MRAFRGCRLEEPSSGSASGAAAALRARGLFGDGIVAESFSVIFVGRFAEATDEPGAESGATASLLEVAAEIGDGTLMAPGVRCPGEATTGIGATSSVGAVDGVVK